MICRHCGHTIPEDSEYCNYCGKAVNNSVNRRNRWLSVICVILAIAVALTSVYLFRSTPTRSTRRFLDAVQQQDWDTARKYYSGDPANLGIPSASTLEKFGDGGAQLYRKLLDKGCDFTYEVVSEKIDGQRAEVTVAFNTYDFGSLLKKKRIPTFKKLSQEVDGLTQRTNKTQCTFNLRKNKRGQWRVTLLGVNQIDAMTGGIYSGTIQAIKTALSNPVSSAGEAASGAAQSVASSAEKAFKSIWGSDSSSDYNIGSVVEQIGGLLEGLYR